MKRTSGIGVNDPDYSQQHKTTRKKYPYPASSKALIFAIEDRWGPFDEDEDEMKDTGNMETIYFTKSGYSKTAKIVDDHYF